MDFQASIPLLLELLFDKYRLPKGRTPRLEAALSVRTMSFPCWTPDL